VKASTSKHTCRGHRARGKPARRATAAAAEGAAGSGSDEDASESASEGGGEAAGRGRAPRGAKWVTTRKKKATRASARRAARSKAAAQKKATEKSGGEEMDSGSDEAAEGDATGTKREPKKDGASDSDGPDDKEDDENEEAEGGAMAADDPLAYVLAPVPLLPRGAVPCDDAGRPLGPFARTVCDCACIAAEHVCQRAHAFSEHRAAAAAAVMRIVDALPVAYAPRMGAFFEVLAADKKPALRSGASPWAAETWMLGNGSIAHCCRLRRG